MGLAMLFGRFLMMIPLLAAAGQPGAEETGPGLGGHLPHARAAVRGAAGGRGADRRRADVLPGALAGADRGTFPDACKADSGANQSMATTMTPPTSPIHVTLMSQEGRAGAPAVRSAHREARHQRFVRQTEPAHHDEEPGHVRGGSGRGHDHASWPCATSPRARPWRGFTFQITLWLWFTVLFANFAEAMAEGRGKAQADTLRKTKTETTARRLLNGNGKSETVAATATAQRRRGAGGAGRDHPRRWRRDRRHRQRGRIGHHRRERAGDPRIGRRPQRRHRRHQGALRLDQGARSPPTPARRSSTA